MSLLGGLIKGVGSVLKGSLSIIPGVGQYMAGQEANQANKDIWRSQRDFSVDMWNLQNAYNDPSAVMKRLENAGLNPNMAYGEIGGGRAGAVSIPAAPDIKPVPALAQGISDYQQVVNMQEQNKLIRANQAKVAAEAEIAKSNARYQSYENDMLMSQGLLKSDSPLVKPVGRVKDYVDSAIVRPVGRAIEGSSLWQGIGDLVSRLSSGVVRNTSTGWRTRQVERYGKGGRK